MPTSTTGIDCGTPLGATLMPGGAAFRLWAPAALQVFLLTEDALRVAEAPGFVPSADDALNRLSDGSWGGFVADLDEGAPYRFWIVGTGSTGLKRDPRARELRREPAYPECDCLVHDPLSYPWHDTGFHPPEFRDLILYQLHIGSYFALDAQGHDKRWRVGRFLDLLDRVDYLRKLGINGVQLLPIQDCSGATSPGCSGLNLYAPETDYQVADDGELDRYLWKANAMFARAGHASLTFEQLRSGPNQLRCVIDLFHLNGIAVLFDLVFTHAGPGLDDRSLRYLDRRPHGDDNRSLYFTARTWAGGNVFAYGNDGVRRFLIDNAVQWVEEFHIDRIRNDEVSVIDKHGGGRFCQDLTHTVRSARPQAIQIAEYWANDRAAAVRPAPQGLGFDATWSDRLRQGIRAVIAQAADGADACVDIDGLAAAFEMPEGFVEAWRMINCIEDHDIVFDGRFPRIPMLADPSNPRSWFARSRSRLATGLLFAGRGIPQIFMGHEILEDKPWNDDVGAHSHRLIWWDGLHSDPAMRDHLAFCRDLISLRRDLPAMRSESLHVSTRNRRDKVIAIHRWIEGSGQDVLMVANLQEAHRSAYRIGFPSHGVWREVFNSDVYDGFPKANAAGNAGNILADELEWDGMPASAAIVLPPNGFVVFTR